MATAVERAAFVGSVNGRCGVIILWTGLRKGNGLPGLDRVPGRPPNWTCKDILLTLHVIVTAVVVATLLVCAVMRCLCGDGTVAHHTEVPSPHCTV